MAEKLDGKEIENSGRAVTGYNHLLDVFKAKGLERR